MAEPRWRRRVRSKAQEALKLDSWQVWGAWPCEVGAPLGKQVGAQIGAQVHVQVGAQVHLQVDICPGLSLRESCLSGTSGEP